MHLSYLRNSSLTTYFIFNVQDNYGTVQIKGHVDREQKNNYTLTVMAEDGGVPLSRKVIFTELKM